MSRSVPAGTGLIHGDSYPGNTLWDGDRTILGDWDNVGTGPRELDLVNTHQGARLGRTAAERQQFTETYGYDVTTWPGFSILEEMRDLHTLVSYIRLAGHGNEHARDQLTYRISTLKRETTTEHYEPPASVLQCGDADQLINYADTALRMTEQQASSDASYKGYNATLPLCSKITAFASLMSKS